MLSSSPEQHQIIPYKQYSINHGSLTEEQVAAVNRLPGQLRQAFLETAERERKRYWQRSRGALVMYGRRRTKEERGQYRDTTALLDQHRQATYTSDIDTVCLLYARLKCDILGVLNPSPSSPPLNQRRLILHVSETHCDSLQEWYTVHPYLYMTLQALQYELIQSGWPSYYYVTSSSDGTTITPTTTTTTTSPNNHIYFLCDFNE